MPGSLCLDHSDRTTFKPFLLMGSFILPRLPIQLLDYPQSWKKILIWYKSGFLQTKLFIFCPNFHIYGELQVPVFRLLKKDFYKLGNTSFPSFLSPGQILFVLNIHQRGTAHYHRLDSNTIK